MFKFYGKFWLATKDQLNDVRLREKAMQKFKETSDRTEAHRIFASLYARYVLLCNNLSDLYDATLQVQKRRVIEKLLESATMRLMELEGEMKNVELSEFLYIDDTIQELHYVPQDIQLLKPFYFPRDRREDIKEIIKEKQKQMREVPGAVVHSNAFKAVLLIQRHERARQKRRIQTEMRMKANEKPKPRKSGSKVKQKSQTAAVSVVPQPMYYFYHKNEQLPLFPVKRTTFQLEFCQELKSFSDYSFYQLPGKIDHEAKRKAEAKRVAHVEFEFLLDPKKIPPKPANFEEEEDDSYALPKCSTIPSNKPIENYIKLEITLKERSSEIFIDPEAAKREEEERIRLHTNNSAAWTIQRNWLLYKIRKLTRMKRIKRMTFLGMIPGENWDHSIMERMQETAKKTRSKKQIFDEQFLRAIRDERARIVKIRSPFLIEDISDHIRDWFRKFYDGTETFDRYPEEFEGGTILVLRGETMTPEEFVEDAIKTPEQKAADKKLAKEEKKRIKSEQKQLKRDIKMRAIDKKAREAKDGITIWQFAYPENISKMFVELDQNMEDYEKEWYFVDEMKNVQQKPIMEFITANEMMEEQIELRRVVDIYMRTEHELLMMALAKDKNVPFKPQKPKKQKKKKNKKKKKEKDATAHRTTQSLYEELLETHIIRKYTKRKLDDFIADRNYLAQEKRRKNEDPENCAGDVIHIIRNSILGMGDLNVTKAKSILLAGAPLTGKKFLTECICTETDAILFDLSPENTRHISSTDADAFYDLVMKMARLLQPSVIFMNNVHKVFYKKIPEEEADLPDPRILSGSLFKKVVKSIQPEDKIILIGCTNEPHKAKPAPMKKCFEKILFLPQMNYGCTFFSWWKACAERSYISKLIELSPLSAVSIGITTGKIVETLNKVLHIKRRMKLPTKPLQLDELLESLLENSPPDIAMEEKEYTKYTTWFQKTNTLAKNRAAWLKQQELLAEKNKKK